MPMRNPRANKFTCDWATVEIAKPKKLGVETILPSLEELRRFIDWSPFFHTWELRGRWNSKEQIFSSASEYSSLIIEYVQRFGGFQGFFTKDNVAELTHAAGEEESLRALQSEAVS